MAIERLVYWNEGAYGWYDKEIDVRITNLTPKDIPEPHHPFDKSYTVTYEQVQAMINEAFQRRIAGGSNLHYFADPLDDNLIVPYSYHRSLMNRVAMIADRLPSVERRRPWWKLW